MGWDETRVQVAQAVAVIRAREVADRGTNTTLEISLLEEIVALDSAQTSAVDTLGAGNLIEHADDGNVRPGRLQQLEAMRTLFFGDSASGQEGLLDMMRKMPDPSEPSEQS